MHRLRRVTVAGLVLALILSGCAPAGPATSITLTMTDFAFLPSTLTVPAGKEITITVTNGGAVTHDLTIMKQGHAIGEGGHVGAQDLEGVYWQLAPLEPGKTLESRFTAPDRPGEYQMLCGVPGHFEAGMVGKLVVVAAP